MPELFGFAATLVLSVGLFFLWSNPVDAQIAGAGLGAALATALAGASVRARWRRSLSPGAGSSVQLARAIARLPIGTARTGAFFVAVLMGRRRHGASFQRPRQAPGRRPGTAGDQAVAVLAECLAPDSFVVEVDEREPALDIHTVGGVP